MNTTLQQLLHTAQTGTSSDFHDDRENAVKHLELKLKTYFSEMENYIAHNEQIALAHAPTNEHQGILVRFTALRTSVGLL